MSYFLFLVLFICLPLSILIIIFYFSKYEDKKFNLKGIFVLSILAIVYTTPWDNYLVANNVWWYGTHRVIGVIGYVPIEEYAFFILQTFLTGLWSFFIFKKLNVHRGEVNSKKLWIVGLIILISIFIYGVYCLLSEPSFYMGLILAWATPIVILQYVIGGRYTLSNFKVFLLCVLPPSFYLWAVDYFAIKDGIWEISDKFTFGIQFGYLPIEEMTFFLMTNIMVAQGLLLFNAMRGKYYFLNRVEHND